MAVWLLLLRTTTLHSHILHSDDLRDAQPQEWQHSESPQRAPQAGNFLKESKWIHSGSANSVHYMALTPVAPRYKCRHLLSISAEEGGRQSRLLPGSHLCPLLVPAAPQQAAQVDHLLPERYLALWAPQVSLHAEQPSHVTEAPKRCNMWELLLKKLEN